MNALRFEEKFVPEPNTGCFVWTGSVDESGYGRFFLNGKNWKANRVAWLLAHGDPGEFHVLHRCDNRLCVNPDHLFLGTNQDNVADKMKKGRHPGALLSPEQVRLIRSRHHNGHGSRRISKETGLSEGAIVNVLYRGGYTHVS